MATLFPFPSSKSQVRAMSSANWAEVPGSKGLASMVSKLETTAYPALLFPSKTKLLLSVYQISSGLVRYCLLTIHLGVLSSGPKFLGKSEREECTEVGRKVAGLRTSQGDVVRAGFSISTA